MDRRVGARFLADSEHRPAGAVHDLERLGAGRAQRDPRGRVVAAGPDVARLRLAQLRECGRALERRIAEDRPVGVVQGSLEGRREHVAVEDARVLVVEDRRFDPAPQQRSRLAHEVLVERVLARDEHREPVSAPSRAAPLLPQRRDRSGEADRDHAVEQADVDPELERVRRRDAEQLALEQAPLDLTPLRRRVARAIGRERRVVAEPVGGEAVDQLGGPPALGEAERAQAARDQIGHQLRGLAQRARAQAELLVGEGRVPERHGALGARRRVVADHRHLGSEQARSQLARVRDRGGGEQELRLRAVDPSEATQPPQHVGHVRAEDAAVDVRLVHDHVGEVREHVAPAVVVRQHAHVEHVRVGEDQVRPLAHLPAALGRRVPVVDRRAELGQAE